MATKRPLVTVDDVCADDCGVLPMIQMSLLWSEAMMILVAWQEMIWIMTSLKATLTPHALQIPTV